MCSEDVESELPQTDTLRHKVVWGFFFVFLGGVEFTLGAGWVRRGYYGLSIRPLVPYYMFSDLFCVCVIDEGLVPI